MLGWTLSILRGLRCAYMWCRKSVHGLCGIIWGGWKGKRDLGCKKSWCSFIQLRGTCTKVFIFWPHKSKLTQKHPQEKRHTNPSFSWTPDSERLSLLKICDSCVKHLKAFQSIFLLPIPYYYQDDLGKPWFFLRVGCSPHLSSYTSYKLEAHRQSAAVLSLPSPQLTKHFRTQQFSFFLIPFVIVIVLRQL